MRLINFWTICLAGALLAGCAATVKADRGRSGQVAATCIDQAQCELYWKRAQDWVAQNSRRPMRSTTDWMLMTESPGVFDSSPTFQVTRWPDPTGSGEIRFEAYCSTFLPCSPGPAHALEEFSRFITAP